jgi:DNA-binding MarR family transcriptional regulator
VRGALNRLEKRGFVNKTWDGQDRRYTLWRITRNKEVYRNVEQKIGISKKRRPPTETPPPTKIAIQPRPDYVKNISTTTRKLSPLKSALKIAFPHAAPPIEVGYQVLANLNTIRDGYKAYSKADPSLKIALNSTITSAVNHTIQNASSFGISGFARVSANYLENRQVFSDLTQQLNLDESYSKTFKSFYQASMKKSLDKIALSENTSW